MTTKAVKNEKPHVFLELYNYKPAWAALEERQRIDYIEKVHAR
jgi:hypothetical protein